MTLVSNDPALWPAINGNRITSYFAVAACVGLTYDLALTFGQEVELIWRQRWSLLTVLYLSVRYLGTVYAVVGIIFSVPTISLTDAGCWILYIVYDWTAVVIFPILSIIIIVRLHAMYQRSRKILIFLVVVSLAVNIFDGVVAVMLTRYTSGEELILSGTYQCSIGSTEDLILLDTTTWILGMVWEVVKLCLAVWIAVKHFRELRRDPTGGIIGDCFTVLMRSHVLYFTGFVVVSCFNLTISLSSIFSANPYSLATQIYGGLVQILMVVQLFVLGPRLILGLREYHAKLVADSDAATGMTSIAFQERVHISTGNGV